MTRLRWTLRAWGRRLLRREPLRYTDVGLLARRLDEMGAHEFAKAVRACAPGEQDRAR